MTRPGDSGPCWTAASWKKLSGGLANEGYNSCYLNSLIQVLRHNDGFHNLLEELSQFASAQKYISDNCRRNNNGSKGGLGSHLIQEKTEDKIIELLYTTTLDLWDAEKEPLAKGDVEEYLPVDANVGRLNQLSQALHLADLLDVVGTRFEHGLQHDIAEASTYLVETLRNIAARRSGANDFPKELTDRYLTIREQRTVVCPVCSTCETPTERILTLLSVSPHMNSHNSHSKNASRSSESPPTSSGEYRGGDGDQTQAVQPQLSEDDQSCDIEQALPLNKTKDPLRTTSARRQEKDQQPISSHPARLSPPALERSLSSFASVPSAPTESVDPAQSSLPMQETLTPQWTLLQAITRYCSQELQWCSTCRVQNQARVQHKFITLPPMLMIHLNRRNDFGQPKDTTKVFINDTLPRLHIKEWNQIMAKLTAIVIHSGEDGAGHYYAYVRRNLDLDEVVVNEQGENDILPQSYNWVCYNDATVTPTTDEEIQEVIDGCGRDGVLSNLSTPVLLVYKLQGY